MSKDKFYIDRQFGQAIWIDVEDGIVKRCYNEAPKFNKKMNENYKGKSISFLKEDFEKRMKPSYHNVRPTSITSAYQRVEGTCSRIRAVSHQMSSIETSDDLKEQLRLKREELFIERAKFEDELKAEKERILIDHNFKS